MSTDAITMAKITWLSQKISADALSVPHLAHLTLVQGEMFRWNYTACAITYNPNDPHACQRLLHEYGHALLNHSGYSRDIELIAMERAAWQEALETAAKFSVAIDSELIEDDIDTYRDWLHARSQCPHCQSTGLQTGPNKYSCLACGGSWRVNQAKHCQLRRYLK